MDEVNALGGNFQMEADSAQVGTGSIKLSDQTIASPESMEFKIHPSTLGDRRAATTAKPDEFPTAVAGSVEFPTFLEGGRVGIDVSAPEVGRRGRENYINFANGVNYLLSKYGTERVPRVLLDKLLTIQDQIRAEPFAREDLINWEIDIIAGSGAGKKAKLNNRLADATKAANVTKAIGLTAYGIVSLATSGGVGMIPAGFSLASKILDNSSMVLDLVGSDGQRIGAFVVPFPNTERPTLPNSLEELRNEAIRNCPPGASEGEILREIGELNFENFYNSVNFLVKKYGREGVPLETLEKAGVDGNELLNIDEETGQESLDPLDPFDRRELMGVFTNKDLRNLEVEILQKSIGPEIDRKYAGAVKLLKIGAITAATAGAIAALVIATGGTAVIPIVIAGASVANSAKDAIQLGLEIRADYKAYKAAKET